MPDSRAKRKTASLYLCIVKCSREAAGARVSLSDGNVTSRSGARTRTSLNGTQDFKSCASANSAIRPLGELLVFVAIVRVSTGYLTTVLTTGCLFKGFLGCRGGSQTKL